MLRSFPAHSGSKPKQVGFKKYEQTGIVVGTQQFVTVDVKMELGSVSEAVTVMAETPLLEAASASQGQVIEHQQIIDLPNLGSQPVHDVPACADSAAGWKSCV